MFVVDCGFRDSVEYLQSKNFDVKIPYFLKGKSQHTATEADYSRLITKIRWVIESVNSRIKKWKHFENILSNKNIEFIEDDFLIICAILNKFRPQVASTNDHDKIEFYKELLFLASKSNPFKDRCLNEFSKRIKKDNQRLCVIDLIFPQLTEEYLEVLTFGVYQLKQAKSYTLDHIDQNGSYMHEVYEQEKNIIHVKIKSRHSNHVNNDCWIQYDNLLKLSNGKNPILNWYCTCKAGARIFGMCAHLCSILWYLGIARNEPKLVEKRRSDFFIELCRDTRRENELTLNK